MGRFKRFQDWANTVLGLWIAVSPAVLAFSNGGGFTVFVGIVLAAIAIIALAKPDSTAVQRSVLVAAAFTFCVPWIFGFAGGAATNIRIVTPVMVVLSIWALRRIGHTETVEATA